jgi:hypothetical protein
LNLIVNRWKYVTVASLFLILSVGGIAEPPPRTEKPADKAGDLASMDIEQLMNLKVTTASLFSDKLSEAPGIMSVVTSDEPRRFGGLTLGEILDRVPGLTQSSQSFSDRASVAADSDLSAPAGGHILMLINGRPTREVMAGGIIADLLESFPVEKGRTFYAGLEFSHGQR